jgi:flagellar biosynthesis chaperone FliJ
LFFLPSDSGKEPPYARGSHECLREAVGIGEQKLAAMNRQIDDLVAIRDELRRELQQFREKLEPPKKSAAAAQASRKVIPGRPSV